MAATYAPQPGHWLRATCSAEDVYEVLAVGRDANGRPTLDARVNAILHFEPDDVLTRDELPEGVSLVLRGLRWDPVVDVSGEGLAVLRVFSPVGGCYRCTDLLYAHASSGGRDPIAVGR